MKLDISRIERILIVRLSALGDCVVAIPVFRALREYFPHAHIAWAIQDNFASLIRNLPGLDETIVFPRQRWKRMDSRVAQIWEGIRFFRHLRKRRFDLAVDVQSNLKSSVLAFLSRAPLRIGHGRDEAKEQSTWLNNRCVAYPPEMEHIVKKNLHLLSALGISGISPEFSIPVDSFSNRRIQNWLHANGLKEKEYVLLFPFCGGKEKEWPGANYTALAKSLAKEGYSVVFGCAPGEEEKAKDLIPLSCEESVFLGPRTSILDLVEMVREARACVGGDTGPLQIGGALRIPSVSLFGPTDPIRSHPWHSSQVDSLKAEPEEIYRRVRGLMEE